MENTTMMMLQWGAYNTQTFQTNLNGQSEDVSSTQAVQYKIQGFGTSTAQIKYKM